ncbi:LysR family transcriptional regulator [Polynucleobacter sp. TUM22923]|jgi:DNA-binding transcriptional LysR family regulator|uniref:LysR family transcriptional regulator n=1 Tax=Polynucleobacter sp. TUM22923 TaxID=3022126 RepID=UPI00257341A3|nr:LysR family transcriptional regulator [Polynucleobacter sp. TUM22923]BDX21846.1 LysR family transcriptional regulator [Polynucleobacter sp. TUM22923]
MSSIRILKNFLVIARHKSVAAAAKEISLTAAAAGQQLQILEAEIGVELFDRTKRSLTLNHHGRAMIEPIQEIVARYESLGSNFKSDLSGTLVLGALVSTLMGAFGSTLNQIKKQYPNLEIKLIAGLSNNFLDQLIEGTLDAAIVTESPYTLPQNIQWTELYTEPMILIYPNLKSKIKRTPRELSGELPFIRFERNTWTGHLVDQTIKSNKLIIQESMELNSVEAIIELVRQGHGFSIIPKLANIAWQDDRQLAISPLSGKTIHRKVGLLERRKHSRQNMTQEIKRLFLEQFNPKVAHLRDTQK